MTNNNFTSNQSNDTILSIEEMLEDCLSMNTQIRFFNKYCMYLYCTVEKETAAIIENALINNTLKMPITLYETPQISELMAVNKQNPTTLKIPINLYGSPKENIYYYDELTMSPVEIKKMFHCSVDQYKKRCRYTRCLVTEPSTKIKVIEYKIYNPSVIQYQNQK